MEYIVKPKLIRRRYKTISVTCGGDNCNKTMEISYNWNDEGFDQITCSNCGKQNKFEIPK